VDAPGPMAEKAKTEGESAPAQPPKQPPSPAPQPSEEEIDSPDRKTLGLLFAVFAVTACCWGAARFACNMHPPESRSAPKLSTDRLVTTAKDCAIEFVQRWRSSDFAGALELAIADAATELASEKATCAANANQCARDREASAGRLTMATLLAQDGFNANVRVVTELKGVKETYLVRLHRDEAGFWKVGAKALEGAPPPAHS
jgi:hypothetical protein